MMVNNVTLPLAMRSSLLSLNNISNQMSKVQEMLSTGKKVNSAIDNASSYYTAQSLSNAAADLNALLDAMGQGIQTIQAANEGMETQAELIAQASGLASKAVEIFPSVEVPPAVSKAWLSEQEGVIAVVSTVDELQVVLNSGEKGDIVIYGKIDCGDVTLNLKEGQNLRGINYYADKNANAKDENYHTSQLTFTKSDTSGAIVTETNTAISDLYIYNKNSSTSSSADVIKAKDGATNALSLSNIKLINEGRGERLISGTVYLENKIDVKNIGTVMESAFGYTNVFAENAEINIDGGGTGTGFLGLGRLFSFKNSILNIVNVSNGINVTSLNIENSTINTQANNYGIQCSLGDLGQSTRFKNSVINISTINSNAYGIYFNSGGGFSTNYYIENTDIKIKNTGRNATGVKFQGVSIKDRTLNILNSKIRIESAEGGKIFDNHSPSETFETLNILAGTELSFNGQNWVSTGYNKIFVPSEVITSLDGVAGWQSAGTVAALTMPDVTKLVEEALNRPADEKFDDDDEFGSVEGYLNRYETYLKENLTDEQKGYMKSFNQTLAEIDKVANDSSYKGVNLLKENTLNIKFSNNEGSAVAVKGVNSTLEGLGLKEAQWSTILDVQKTMEELTEATNKLRTQMSQIGNYNAIVTNREDFTQNLINVLEEGADKLTLADMNEVSAEYLSLQTAQSLAINSLSLAAQSARSVLIPFAAQQIYAENQADKSTSMVKNEA